MTADEIAREIDSAVADMDQEAFNAFVAGLRNRWVGLRARRVGHLIGALQRELVWFKQGAREVKGGISSPLRAKAMARRRGKETP